MTRLAMLGAVVVLATLAIWHPAPRPVPIVTERGTQLTHAAHSRLAMAQTAVVVYVVGAVSRPGLYHIAAGSRADDAVRLAGGLRTDADPAGVNLAERVDDGEQITVPKVGDAPAARPRRAVRTGKRRSHPSSVPIPTLARVDLNDADVAALEELPGVGPALAERIVAYRNLNGPFESLDELSDVAGMTDRRLQQVAPFLIVH
ncbi:MAG: ComEA family DNA-binding protein [Vulcanimicrobiaceae bacterium]